MPEISSEELYYNYILGISNDFHSLPVPKTQMDGKLYRLCCVRRDAGNAPERNAINQVVDAEVGASVTEMTSNMNQTNNSLDSDLLFSYLELKKARIVPATGAIDDTLEGAWSCENYYDIYKIDTAKSVLRVPEGYLLKIYYYDKNKSYIDNDEFQEQAIKFKEINGQNHYYARFAIKRDAPGYPAFELTDEIKYSVVVATRKEVSKDLADVKNTLATVRDTLDGDFLYTHLTLKQEEIDNTTGALDNTHYRAWADETYYDCDKIDDQHSTLSVPEGYVLRCFYYDNDKTYLASNTAQQQTIFRGTNYKYVRFHIQRSETITPFPLTDEIKYSVVVATRKSMSSDLMPHRAGTFVSYDSSVTFENIGNGVYIANGTAGSQAFGTVYLGELPDGITAGEEYYVMVEGGLPSRFRLQVRCTEDGSNYTMLMDRHCGQKITIPFQTVRIQFRLFVINGITVDNEKIMLRLYRTDSKEYLSMYPPKFLPPMLSIVYDDGHKEFLQYILPIIQEKHVPISTAIITEYSSDPTNNPNFMSFDEIATCYLHGAEVLTHALQKSEEEWNQMTVEEIANVYQKSYNILCYQGFHVPSCFVYSGASSSIPVTRKAANRVFHSGLNGTMNHINRYGEIDPIYINRYDADNKTLAQLKTWIDDLVTAGTGWMVWTRHNSNYSQETPTDAANMLRTVIDYAIANNIAIVTVERGLHEYLGIY